MPHARRLLFAITALVALLATACASTTDPEVTADQEEIGPSIYERGDNELEGDRERKPGEPADVHELRATLIGAAFQQEISATDIAGYLVATVKIENVDADETHYDRLDWVLHLPDGTEINRASARGVEGQLGDGDLAPSASAEGNAIFQIGDKRGDFYVVYAPRRHASSADADKQRGVWKVTL